MPCVYGTNHRVAKRELQRENGELRERKALSDQIFHALRSDRQVLNILQMLRDQDDLASIANVAQSPSIESHVGSPTEVGSVAKEELLLDTCGSRDYHSPQMATVPSKVLCPWRDPWIAAFCDQQLIKHLFSLYWVWIHPAYNLFNMEQFVAGFKTGNEEHCSAFLVAAVCAAACDLLGPHWTALSGKIPDTTTLKQQFIAEAIRQEGLTDCRAKTWSQASRVMLFVTGGSEVSCSTPATGFVQNEG